MNRTITSIVSWLIALWSAYIFLSSLPYKFTNHSDTQHIFGTIGDWLGGFLGPASGNAFTQFGAYVVGSFELIASVVLLLPALLWVIAKIRSTPNEGVRAKFHAIGGLLAAGVMAGAVFFHLFSPLGIEVLHEGKSDEGSLFFAALSILVLGLVLFALNVKTALAKHTPPN